jgi:hypothetical protein
MIFAVERQFCWRAATWFAAVALLSLALSSAAATRPEESPVLFSPRGGAFATNVSLKLSAREGSAVIRYTIDGSEPNETSPAYSSPLSLTNTTLVRAKAFPENKPPSVPCAEIYTVLEEELGEFTSNLPLMIVHTFGTNVSRDERIEGALQVTDGGKERTTLTRPASISHRALLNVRGRASLRYPKNSFTVKMIDSAGDPESVSFFGFPADNDWVLYAPYPDKTLMRDVLAYELHAMMGHWAPRTKFVEVFVQRTPGKLSRRDYAGVYVFEERVKRGKDRVNVAKLKPDDDAEPRITGGYIFKKDHTDSGGGPVGGEGYGAGPVSQSTRAGYPTGPGNFPADPKGFGPAATVTRSSSSSSSSRSSRANPVYTNHLGFASTRLPLVNRESLPDESEALKDEEYFRTTLRTNQFYFVEPDVDEITAPQKVWLKNHLNRLEAALYGPDFRDPTKGYRAFIEPGSFVDYHLITEFTKNVDGFRFSVFYHKDRGGKIKADPIWDWNLSFGNANGKQGWMPEYWLWPQLDDKEYTWYRRLFDDPDFGQLYVDRWSQLRTNILATKRILGRVDEIASLLEESQKRNYERWPILGRAINPNWYFGSTYEEEVNWMKQFITARLDWMEKQFVPVPQLKKSGNAAELSSAVGDIYFTSDGSDPRASGGDVAKNVQAYKSPVKIGKGAKIVARTREGTRWSGPMVFTE